MGKSKGSGKPPPKNSFIRFIHELHELTISISPRGPAPKTAWGRYWPAWFGSTFALTIQASAYGRKGIRAVYEGLGYLTGGYLITAAIIVLAAILGFISSRDEHSDPYRRFVRGIIIVPLAFYLANVLATFSAIFK